MTKLKEMCPKCLSTKLRRYNIYYYKGISSPRYKCKDCGYLTIYPLMRLRAERRSR